MNGIRPKIVEFVKTSAEKVPFAAKNRTVAYPTAGHPTEKNVELVKESAQKRNRSPRWSGKRGGNNSPPRNALTPAKTPFRSRHEPRKPRFAAVHIW
jgi:hypothetical protein